MSRPPRSPRRAAPAAPASAPTPLSTAPEINPEQIEANATSAGVEAASIQQDQAMLDIIEHDLATGQADRILEHLSVLAQGASPDELGRLRAVLGDSPAPRSSGTSADDELAKGWREVAYPYRNRMSRKNYEKQKYELQV